MNAELVTRHSKLETRVALKEWAVACEALGRGQQVLLLRKGGIREEAREFKVEHRQFLLYPSYEHQTPELLKPSAHADLTAILKSRGPDAQVVLRYWASVAKVLEVAEPQQLEAVSAEHIWSDGYALERLRWRPRKPLQLLALRVYRLPQPTTLSVIPAYGGCKSWLTLAEPVVVEGARPVLEESEFAARVERVRCAIAGAIQAPGLR